MAEKKVTAEKKQLHYDFEEFILKLLGDTPVVKVADLERQVHAEFAGRIAAAGLGKPLKSGRAEWANLVDWVKARMTGRDETRYFKVGPHEYLAYLPDCGHVSGTRLVTQADAARLWDALIGIITHQ